MASQDVLTKDPSQGQLLTGHEALSQSSGTVSLTSKVDPTLVSELHPLTDFLLIGGPVVWILLLFSIVALSIALIKFWQFKNC